MPSIKNAIARNQNLIASGKNLVSDVDASQSISQGPMPPAQVTGLPVRGVYTPNQILATDFAANTSGMRVSPNLRSATFPPQSTPQVAQKTTQVVEESGSTASSLLIKVNGLIAPDQEVLDLSAGNSNLTISPGINGKVLFSAEGGFSPNLAIGDTFVNWPQSDPASVILVDDFLYSGSTFGTAGTSGTIGQLGWLAFSIGGTLGNYPSPAPHLGSIQIETSTTVNSGNTFVLAQEGITGSILSGIPITTMVGWEAHFVFKWPSFVAGSSPNATAKTRMYLGFGQPQNASTTFARPTKFLGLRFDTDTTSPSIADTTYHYEFVQNGSVTNTQGTVVNSGIAPDFNWHRFTMRCLVAGTVLCSIDGGTESSLAVGNDTASITSLTNHATGDASVAIVSWVGYQCPGTNLTVAGITKSGFTKYNGAWTVEFVGTNPNLAFITSILTSEGTGTITGATASWSNAFAPWFQFGNSSETTPASKLLVWDYFSFVYNPQLAADWASPAPDPTKPRYFPAQT